MSRFSPLGLFNFCFCFCYKLNSVEIVMFYWQFWLSPTILDTFGSKYVVKIIAGIVLLPAIIVDNYFIRIESSTVATLYFERCVYLYVCVCVCKIHRERANILVYYDKVIIYETVCQMWSAKMICCCGGGGWWLVGQEIINLWLFVYNY